MRKRLWQFSLLALLLLPGAARAQFAAQWNFQDFTQNNQPIKAVYITPLWNISVNGATNIVASQRQSKQTGSQGSLVVSNMVYGAYRVEFLGPTRTNVFTNCFDVSIATNSLINAADYICVGTNSTSASDYAYTRAQSNQRFATNVTPSVVGYVATAVDTSGHYDWEPGGGGSGSGDMVGPSSSTASNLVIFANALGKVTKDSEIAATNVALMTYVLGLSNSVVSRFSASNTVYQTQLQDSNTVYQAQFAAAQTFATGVSNKWNSGSNDLNTAIAAKAPESTFEAFTNSINTGGFAPTNRFLTHVDPSPYTNNSSAGITITNLGDGSHSNFVFADINGREFSVLMGSGLTYNAATKTLSAPTGGAGDVVAANNLSEYTATAATARANIGAEAAGAGVTAATAATNGWPWGSLYDAAGAATNALFQAAGSSIAFALSNNVAIKDRPDLEGVFSAAGTNFVDGILFAPRFGLSTSLKGRSVTGRTANYSSDGWGSFITNTVGLSLPVSVSNVTVVVTFKLPFGYQQASQGGILWSLGNVSTLNSISAYDLIDQLMVQEQFALKAWPGANNSSFSNACMPLWNDTYSYQVLSAQLGEHITMAFQRDVSGNWRMYEDTILCKIGVSNPSFNWLSPTNATGGFDTFNVGGDVVTNSWGATITNSLVSSVFIFSSTNYDSVIRGYQCALWAMQGDTITAMFGDSRLAGSGGAAPEDVGFFVERDSPGSYFRNWAEGGTKSLSFTSTFVAGGGLGFFTNAPANKILHKNAIYGFGVNDVYLDSQTAAQTFSRITNGLFVLANNGVTIKFLDIYQVGTNASAFTYSLANETNCFTVNQMVRTNTLLPVSDYIPLRDIISQAIINTNGLFSKDGVHLNTRSNSLADEMIAHFILHPALPNITNTTPFDSLALDASQLTGTIPLAALPSSVITNRWQNTFTNAGLHITVGETNDSLTASTDLEADANKQIISLANGTGIKTNNGSGNVGWSRKPLLDLGASTNFADTNIVISTNNWNWPGPTNNLDFARGTLQRYRPADTTPLSITNFLNFPVGQVGPMVLRIENTNLTALSVKLPATLTATNSLGGLTVSVNASNQLQMLFTVDPVETNVLFTEQQLIK